LPSARYLHVDPANRLVADSLEADWNEKLRALTAAQEHYEQQRQQDRAAVDEQQRARIAALASDFPRLWQDPKTPDRERNAWSACCWPDVTLIRGDQIAVHVRFSGGATKDAGVAEAVDGLRTQNDASGDCRRGRSANRSLHR